MSPLKVSISKMVLRPTYLSLPFEKAGTRYGRDFLP